MEGEDLRGLLRYWPHGVSVLTVDHDPVSNIDYVEDRKKLIVETLNKTL